MLLIFSGCRKDSISINEPKFDSKVVFNGFEPLWKDYLESSHDGWQNNDKGRFSNDDAPSMEALLILYQLTGDVRYLDTLSKTAKRILENDDISRQTADVHRGNKVLPGWSSTRYTADSSRTIFLLDDALILLPLVKAYNNLKNTDLSDKYQVTTWLNRAIREFETVYKPEWKTINAEEGYFEDVYYTAIGLKMPMNQYSIPGLLSLELYKATGNELYLDYAVKTANYVKKNLKIINNSYVWYYKLPSINYSWLNYDDFSHAQLVTHFIIEMYLYNKVFTKNDLALLVKTFLIQVMDGNKVYRYFGGMINETTPLPSDQKHSEDPWLTYFFLLVPYSSDVYSKMKFYHTNRKIIYNSASDFNHLGEFLLLHYAYQLKYIY